jgi:cytosine/adenosine deaminase-related metal-dependent hydrolase
LRLLPVESGITTMHAWEHNLQTPAHADAVLQAMSESGMRGRFSYRPSSDPEAGSSFAQGTETIDFDDVLRVRGERLEHDDGELVDLDPARLAADAQAAVAGLSERLGRALT